MLKQQIEQDLKTALLSGDKIGATTLRGLKSAILYAEVDGKNRSEGLNDQQIMDVLLKEAKKRQESADLYRLGGDKVRADQEDTEKRIIEKYLPKKLSDPELIKMIEEEISALSQPTIKDMGRIIAAVKSKAGASAEGAKIAGLVRERLS